MNRDKTLAILREHRTEFERFGVVSVRLFGSVARDEASADSDVDVLVDFGGPPSFDRLMDFRFFLEDLLGTRVDVVTESGLRDRVRPYVEREAISVS